MTDVTADAVRAGELRQGLVDGLVADGVIVSPLVEAAFRAVPRHLFAPEATVEAAYARDIVVVKRDEHGATSSSVSAPQIQATMLEQAGVGRGMRCLEIGSGGYNAALLAEVVGEGGQVTTVDIDSEVIDRARRLLSAAGYGRVHAVVGDGESGWAEHAPYDRIIVTAGAWDIPSAWVDQLAEGGTLTVPLRMRGLTRSITFALEDGRLVSQTAEVCGFVPMQGAGAHRERLLLLRGQEVGLRFDEGAVPDPDPLTGALEFERVEVWSGVTISRVEPFDTLQLWLACALDGFCLLSVDRALDTGVVAPVSAIATPAVVADDTFSYLAVRRLDGAMAEFGAHGFGPKAEELAEELAEQVRVWDRELRDGPGPRVEVYPADAAESELPDGLLITKRHAHVLISWPTPAR